MKKSILFILPGWGGSKKTWADFVLFAKNEFDKVEVIELPCFGSVPCPDIVWGVEEYSTYTKEKINELLNYHKEPKNGTNIILLGHSFGGVIAANIVATNPYIVDKLVLSGAPLYRPKYYPKRIIIGLLTKVLKILLAPLPTKLKNTIRKKCYKIIGSPDYAKTDGIQQEIFKKIIRQDTSHNCKKITIPTVVLWGENDTYVPLRFGKKIATHIPQAIFTVIKNGPHGLHLKKKKELLETIKKFISS